MHRSHAGARPDELHQEFGAELRDATILLCRGTFCSVAYITWKNIREREGGKTEIWFVLDALPESRIYAGLLPGVEETHLRAALDRGQVADCLYSFRPQPGDSVFLPAGTVHAVGGGVLLAEVQQTVREFGLQQE